MPDGLIDTFFPNINCERLMSCSGIPWDVVNNDGIYIYVSSFYLFMIGLLSMKDSLHADCMYVGIQAYSHVYVHISLQ